LNRYSLLELKDQISSTLALVITSSMRALVMTHLMPALVMT